MIPEILLITGNMASGKSSVAQALAERLPTSVHLRGDLFRRMIVNGQADMTFGLTDEGERQLQLRYELAAIVAKRYIAAGFTVVYQDIIIGQALDDALATFSGYRLGIVVLCPRAGTLAVRDKARSKTGYADRETIDSFDRVLRTETSHVGYWHDNSDETLAETVDAIMSNLAKAEV